MIALPMGGMGQTSHLPTLQNLSSMLLKPKAAKPLCNSTPTHFLVHVLLRSLSYFNTSTSHGFKHRHKRFTINKFAFSISQPLPKIV